MYLDSQLIFDPAGTAVTTSADSTNVLDLGANRDLGVGDDEAEILVLVQQGFASATASATLNVQLMGAPDNGSGSPGGYTVLVESGNLLLGQLAAGMKLLTVDVASVTQNPLPPVSTTGTFSANSTSVTVASGTGIEEGQFVAGTGIVPGTYVSSVSGTTVTLSADTSAAGTGVDLYFSSATPYPRFLKLHYAVSNTMTAGQVQSGINIGNDYPAFYKPGVVVNN